MAEGNLGPGVHAEFLDVAGGQEYDEAVRRHDLERLVGVLLRVLIEDDPKYCDMYVRTCTRPFLRVVPRLGPSLSTSGQSNLQFFMAFAARTRAVIHQPKRATKAT